MYNKPRTFKYKLVYKNFIKKNISSPKINSGNCFLKVGTIGIKILESCKLQVYQLEAIKKVLIFYSKKSSLVWFPNAHFNIPLSKKAAGARMGKGKGKLRNWCTNLFKGAILAEFVFVPNVNANKAWRDLLHKIPAKFILVQRRQVWLNDTYVIKHYIK